MGAPKTGTTYLQTILWDNQDALGERGVFLPGRNRFDHFSAGFDLRGVKQEPGDPRKNWDGAWDRLATKIQNSESDVAVVSDERLASCRISEAKRVVDSLAPAEVHVIYVTRDPAGLLSAAWQEHVKHGYRRGFEDWLTDTLNPSGTEWYWKVHDVGEVLRRWKTAVPHDNLHLVTLPPRGSAPDLLWRRFCSVLDISPDGVDTDTRANVSLGVEGTELMRRINEKLPDDFPTWQQIGVGRDMLANNVLAKRQGKTSINVSERLADQVERYTEKLIADITASEVDVTGDLDDLRAGATRATAMAEDVDVTDAAIDGLAGLMAQTAELRDDWRTMKRELVTAKAQRKAAVHRAEKAEAALRNRRRAEATRTHRVKRRVVALGARSRPVGAALRVYRRLRRG
ncbi:MAG: hypothetical protein GEU97_02050 [Actinophytocola sp.]|nr:hypothetical protein [Actinophytocola sp.]